jgi:hypothetical protein
VLRYDGEMNMKMKKNKAVKDSKGVSIETQSNKEISIENEIYSGV